MIDTSLTLWILPSIVAKTDYLLSLAVTQLSKMSDLHETIQDAVDHWVTYKCLVPCDLKDAKFEDWSEAIIDMMCRSRHFDHFNDSQHEIWIKDGHIYLEFEATFESDLVEGDLQIKTKCLFPDCNYFPMANTRWCSSHQTFKGQEAYYQLICDKKLEDIQVSIDNKYKSILTEPHPKSLKLNIYWSDQEGYYESSIDFELVGITDKDHDE